MQWQPADEVRSKDCADGLCMACIQCRLPGCKLCSIKLLAHTLQSPPLLRPADANCVYQS